MSSEMKAVRAYIKQEKLKLQLRRIIGDETMEAINQRAAYDENDAYALGFEDGEKKMALLILKELES